VILNDYQKRRFATNIVKTMFNTVSDKQIGVWGWAFKKDTNDTRESAAIYVCRDLLYERARLHVYDPRVTREQIVADLKYVMADSNGVVAPIDDKLIERNVNVGRSAYEVASGAHAIAVMTEWDEFTRLDFQKVYSSMPKPAFVFDGRNILDDKLLKRIGFEVHSVGK
jgi:UDPglucose 6-dehydrogenase